MEKRSSGIAEMVKIKSDCLHGRSQGVLWWSGCQFERGKGGAKRRTLSLNTSVGTMEICLSNSVISGVAARL